MRRAAHDASYTPTYLVKRQLRIRNQCNVGRQTVADGGVGAERTGRREDGGRQVVGPRGLGVGRLAEAALEREETRDAPYLIKRRILGMACIIMKMRPTPEQ